MAEPLIVALTLDAIATHVTLMQGGARRFEERLVHGSLALAAADVTGADVRRAIRLDAVAALLAGFGEDAARPDAFVALGGGAGQPGVYAARDPGDAPAADAAALAHGLSERAGVPAYVVEPVGRVPAGEGMIDDPERALLVRAALRRDGATDGERIVVLAEPGALVCACRDEMIVAAVAPLGGLPGATDVTGLLRRTAHGDEQAAAALTAYIAGVVVAARTAAMYLHGVAAVLLSGTLAAHAGIAEPLAAALRALAPVRLRPGARIDAALADAALAALNGQEPVRRYG